MERDKPRTNQSTANHLEKLGKVKLQRSRRHSSGSRPALEYSDQFNSAHGSSLTSATRLARLPSHDQGVQGAYTAGNSEANGAQSMIYETLKRVNS